MFPKRPVSSCDTLCTIESATNRDRDIYMSATGTSFMSLISYTRDTHLVIQFFRLCLPTGKAQVVYEKLMLNLHSVLHSHIRHAACTEAVSSCKQCRLKVQRWYRFLHVLCLLCAENA
jgi:hypothetical protein